MYEMKAQRMRTWVDSFLSEYEFTTQYKHVKLMETFQSKQVNQKNFKNKKPTPQDMIDRVKINPRHFPQN